MMLPIIDENGKKRCPYCYAEKATVKNYDVATGKERRLGTFKFILKCDSCEATYVDITDLGPNKKRRNKQ